MRKLRFALLVVALAAAGTFAASALPRSAASQDAPALQLSDHVTICHHAGGSGNYVQNSPSVEGVLSGHVGHQDELDVIPAFDYIDRDGVVKSFPGEPSSLTDAQRSAFVANGCAAPATTTTDDTPTTPTTTTTGTTPTTTTTGTTPTTTTTGTTPTTTAPGTPASSPTAVDLALTKAVDRSPVAVGGRVTYTLVVTNIGTAPATAVTVVDDLPVGVTLVSTAGRGTCSGTTRITCVLGSLAPGESVTVTVVARATTVGTFTNVAVAAAAQDDPSRDNNTGRADVRVTGAFTPPAAGCAVSVSAPARVIVGRKTMLPVTVRGAKRQLLTGARVSAFGAGISLSRTTDAHGVARFPIAPRRVGVIRFVVAGSNGCPVRTRLVRALGAFQPPKPSFTG